MRSGITRSRLNEVIEGRPLSSAQLRVLSVYVLWYYVCMSVRAIANYTAKCVPKATK